MNTLEFIFLQQTGLLHVFAVCAAFALASYGAGVLILRRYDFISFALGALVTGVLFFGLFYLFSPALAAGPVFLVPFFILSAAGFFFFCRSFLKNKLLFLLSGLLFFALAGSALLPPYAWDEQVYQLGLLGRYVRNNSLAVLKDNPYSAWPGFLQAYLLPGFMTGGLNFPRLFNTLLTVILTGSLFSCVRFAGKKSAWILTLVFLLSPLTLILTRSLYAENTVTLFALAGVCSLFRLRKTPSLACLLAGAFAGGALAVKLTSGGAALALLFLTLCEKRNRKFFYLFILGGVLAAGPFFLRIWCETGNPVYPFAASLFGTSPVVESHHLLLGSHRYGMGPLYGTLFGPFATAFAGKIYDGAVTGFQQIVMLVLLLFALRFSPFPFKRSPLFKRLGGALLIFYLFWSLSSQQCRFLYPGFFLLVFLAAAALRKLSAKSRKVFLFLLLAGTFFSFDLYSQAKHFFVAWRILTPARREPLRFLAFAQKDPDFIQILDAAGRTPPQSRFLLLFEKRGLYLPRAYQLSEPQFQEKFFSKIPASTAELMKELSGADYLLLGSNEKNVDLQESSLALQKHLYSLILQAVREGKLSFTASGRQNSCHLLKINDLTK